MLTELELREAMRNSVREKLRARPIIHKQRKRKNRRRTLIQKYKAEYLVYRGIISRCHNALHPSYPYYGGQALKVCDRWRFGEGGKTGFQCFIEDMGPRPGWYYDLDRIDPYKGYDPDNCRWLRRDIHQSFGAKRWK